MARPPAISVVAAFLLLATLIAGIVGTALLFPGTPLDRIWTLNEPAHAAFEMLGRTAGALLWLLGLLTAATAAGLIGGRRWAWWLAIAIFAVNGAGDIVGLFTTHDAIRSGTGVLVAAAFLL